MKRTAKFLAIPVALLVLVPASLALLFTLVNHTNGTIISKGLKRTYLLYVPKSYVPGKPTPLVISIHGYSEWPAHQMQISRWNTLADEKGFIVVYPSGTDMPMRWNATGLPASSGRPDDVQFISDLIDHLQQDYTIDPDRIYANGLSNGGGMSFLLGCKLSDRIAAVGGVSGAYLLPWDQCTPGRLAPMIVFHGTADPIVPFQGGRSFLFDYPFPVIPDWVKALAGQHECSGQPVTLPAKGEVSGIQYTGCKQNASVVFYTIQGGGHTWPGGGYLPAIIAGRTSRDIDATRVMWEFFEQHPLK